MLIPTALLASIVAVIIGGLILWSNPARAVNRVVFACSLHIAAWLGCLHITIIVPPGEGLFWLRWSCTIGGGLPLSFWIVKESIAANFDDFGLNWIVRRWGWIAAPAILMAIPFTGMFIPAHSTSSNRVFGWGYYGYMWSLLGLYSYMFYDAYRSGELYRDSTSGGRRK